MAAGAVLGLSWGCGCIIKDCYTSVVAETVLGVLPPPHPLPSIAKIYPFLLLHVRSVELRLLGGPQLQCAATEMHRCGATLSGQTMALTTVVIQQMRHQRLSEVCNPGVWHIRQCGVSGKGCSRALGIRDKG